MSRKFKYLRCVLDESSADEAEYSRNVASGRSSAGAIRSLVNAGVCSLGVLESCMNNCWYGSETMIRREKERSKIRAVQMHNLSSAAYQENE